MTVPEWGSRLHTCRVFEQQKRSGGRGAPADEVLTKLLSALDQRGGKMTSMALVRTLNVDGYDVLRRDEA